MSLVSIIIPVYNAEEFITDTLRSVLEQDHQQMEILVVNDGSTDTSMEKCRALNDERIRIMDKNNTGVSDSRNVGLQQASGKYVCFFDADDLMAPQFLSARVNFMEENQEYIGVCGQVVKKFQQTGQIQTDKFDGISTDPFKNILLFNKRSITCPSNFLFRRSWIESAQVKFNSLLSSSADRFFLLEVSLWGNIYQINKENTELVYLIRTNSMSHMLTETLLEDNLKFKNEVLKKIPLSKAYRKQFRFKMNYILCGGHYKRKNWKKFVTYFAYTALINPVKFIQQRY